MPDVSKPVAVHVSEVSKSFKSGPDVTHALRSVNFEARKGELLMIVGPSGCGKTTLLSVIAGTLRFNSGKVDVLGRSLHSMSDEEITNFRKKHIGFIFQQYHLIKTLSILENVSIPLILNGCPIAEACERAEAMLTEVGLKGRSKERPANLSGGQQQRVAIARALVHNPDLLICDEPTAALDADTGAHILDLLRTIAKGPDRTVIVVTHDSRIFKYADRMTKMDDGKVLDTETKMRTT